MQQEDIEEYNENFRYVLSVIDIVSALDGQSLSEHHAAVNCIMEEASNRMMRIDEIVKDPALGPNNVLLLKKEGSNS